MVREGVDMPQAIYHVRATIGVLQEALSKGETFDIRAQLPAEYNRLFETGNGAQA
jgi:uncharacterized protein (DUF2267 family)